MSIQDLITLVDKQHLANAAKKANQHMRHTSESDQAMDELLTLVDQAVTKKLQLGQPSKTVNYTRADVQAAARKVLRVLDPDDVTIGLHEFLYQG